MFSNLRLVQFSDGFYAIRKGWIFYSYKDLCSRDIWWTKGEMYILEIVSIITMNMYLKNMNNYF